MSDSRDIKRRAYELFDEACDLPNAERSAFLDARCGADHELRAAIETMLREDAAPEADLALGGGAELIAAELARSSAAALPARIGRYRVISEIGRGGMGVVYEAEQDEPRRRVALKIIRDGFASDDIRTRFVREAELLGRLHHPGIAHVYEAGTDAIGGKPTPFFAMELVDGTRLDTYVQETSPTLREVLALFLLICDAVHYAHQNGVIHRDLKPANVLVKKSSTTVSSTRGPSALAHPKCETRILDFGVARISDPDSQATLQTSAGQIIGTVAYMSPEQLDGDPSAIDERADVYALGVMMYQSLAGRMPIATEGKPIAEAARLIRDSTPPRLGSINRRLRGDVESIVAKAMDSDRSARYATPAALAADIRRYLTDETIVARRVGAWHQLRKFARRNKGLAGGVAASFVLLLAGAAGTSIGLASAVSSNHELKVTNQELKVRNNQLERLTEFQASQLSDLDAQAIGVRLREIILDSAEAGEEEQLSRGLRNLNPTTAVLGLLDEYLVERSATTINANFAEEPAVRGRLLDALATTALGFGLLDQALSVAQTAEAIHNGEFGEASPEALSSASTVGRVLVAQEAWDAALVQYEGMLSRIEQFYGSGSVESLMNAHDRAVVLAQLARTDEAFELLEPVLGKLTALVGENDERTLSVIKAMSSVYYERGDYEPALRLVGRLVEGRRRVLGENHPDTLAALSTQSVWLSRTGNLERSAELDREVLAIRRRVLGDKHPDTLSSVANAAIAISNLNRLEEAEALAREAYEGRVEVLGLLSDATLSSLNTLASILQSQGRYEEAEAMYREAIEGRQLLFGDDHPRTLLTRTNLATVLNDQDRFDEAAELYQSVFERFNAAYGANHQYTLQAMGNYASILVDIERHDEAADILQRLLDLRIAFYGPDHHQVAHAKYTLGRCLLRAKRLDEAEPYCLSALEQYESVSSEHIGTLYSLGLVAKLRLAQGRIDEAVRLLQSTIERRERVLGPDHPLTIDARDELAALRADG